MRMSLSPNRFAAPAVVRQIGRMTGHVVFAGVMLWSLAAAAQTTPPPPTLNPPFDPTSFEVTVFASGLNYPTSMQRLSDGSLLVATSRPTGGSFFNSTGELVRLVDADGDGVADGPGAVLYSGLPGAVTSVRQAGNLIFATSSQAGQERISVLRPGAAPGDPLGLVGSLDFDFPADWLHTTYALAVRPTPGEPGAHDLVFNVGSRTNAERTTGTVAVGGLISGTLNPDALYMVTVRDTGATPAVSNLTQIASGLRNAAGIAFHPTTGDLYFQDNGIDTPGNLPEPLSGDELNRITAAVIGQTVVDFGFPDSYVEYRTGAFVGDPATRPLVGFSPIPDPSTGAESEGAFEIAFAPPGFPDPFRDGLFVGFHGQYNSGGLANEENPLVFLDLESLAYSHAIGVDEPGIGHPIGLLASGDSLFLADMSSTGELFGPAGTGAGVIYQIRYVPEPAGFVLLGTGLLAWAGLRARVRARARSRAGAGVP